MENIKVYKFFISSPGDCAEEREICQETLDEMNKVVGKFLRIRFETFMWENDVLPDMGRNGQEIIDEQIKKYDIFIGIMKNRFGTPTKKAGSGTEHEFNDALLAKEKSGNSYPKILFFFGKKSVNPETFDPEQYNQVKKFKKRIEGKGIYIDFDEENPFRKQLENKISLFVQDLSPLDNPSEKIDEIDLILKKTKKDLEDSLETYRVKSPVWIEPIISTQKEVPSNPTKNNDYRIECSTLIENPSNIIIKAPSEFGLTTLAHFLKSEAWKEGKRFVYIDAQKTKPHKVVKDIKNIAESYFCSNENSIDCILLDSICFEEPGIMKMVKNICDSYEKIPLIIFNTTGNDFFIRSDEDDKVNIKRNFTSYYLLPLPQNEIRKIVTSYSINNSLEEDQESILTKITKDLEILNMHRTAKNCISLLKACSNMDGDYCPVNRTELLETLLNTIFKNYEIPTYHDKKPDVKDCSFVLGYLSELLIKSGEFQFDDDFFRKKLSSFCEENFIELDLKYLIDVLKDNSIIGVDLLGNNYFKNLYWLFYFVAQRMNINKKFCDYIFENKKYIDYPIIIEFYTGIDRNKEDALQILNRDIEATLNSVRNKVKLPDKINPFKAIRWTPDEETLKKEDKKISVNVISSGLPSEVKDKYDDKYYNQIRPYDQVINSVIREYSFLVLMRQISATSKALRNSDFINDTSLKKELLDKILQGWHEINKLLIVISPLLADKGDIAFEGANFHLVENDFRYDDPKKKRLAVLLAVPTNVVRIFKDDLFSMRIGPLLIYKAQNTNNSLLKHELMLLIIAERPKKWREVIDNYIVSLNYNSFFLSDTLAVLKYNIEYNETELNSINQLKNLERKCIAKHLSKKKNPDSGFIKRINK